MKYKRNIRIDMLIMFSMVFFVPFSKYLESKTYISDLFSLWIIITTGIISVLSKLFCNKEKLKFSWIGFAMSFTVDFLGKGIIVACMLLSLNYYFKNEQQTMVSKKIEDNFKKGPNGIRFVIISNPNKMINIGKDYNMEYKSINLSLSNGFLGFKIIEDYKLNY